ncbi:MAG: trigger factor [Actinomycetota bacterium]|nr:trigger factor [Actinomycetota bacterium]
MKTEIEKLEERNTVLLTVEVPVDTFERAIDEAYKKISSQVVIPGFRKGKIPKTIIDSRVGRESVQEEALQSSLPRYYVEALQDAGLDPVDQPEVDIVQVGDDIPLKFTAKVKIKPEVKLGEYKGIELAKPSIEASEEEVDEQIEAIRNNFANLEPIEDRAVQNGDYALINFDGFIDGQPFDGGSAEDYLLEIGSGTFIPGFEEQIVGVKKGEAKDVIVTFPKDYGSEQLAGKEAVFKILLKEIKEKKLQELNDDFAKQVGFDTLDELKSDVKKKISEVKAKNVDAEVRGSAVDIVTDAAEVELHDVMVEQELDTMVEDFEEEVKRQGVELNQYLEMVSSSIEELRAEWNERAHHRVKSRLVLDSIATLEKIEAGAEDIDNEIRKVSAATGRDFEEVKQIFMMQGNIGTLATRIKLAKTIDWLVEQAKIKTDEKPNAEEKEDKKAKKRNTKAEASTEASKVTEEEKGTD